jgi:phospholipid transport system substrate-binding protein
MTRRSLKYMSKINNLCRALLLLFIVHTSASATDKAIADYVDGIVSAFFAITKNSALSEQDKVSKASSLLEASLDFDWMGKFVLGRYRRNLSEADLKDFLLVYKTYLIKTYADAMRHYKGETITIKNVHLLSDDEYVVKTNINKKDQNPIAVDYLIRSATMPYKVFDVVTEGVSLVSSQQAEFGSIMGNSGVRTLIDYLNKKILP